MSLFKSKSMLFRIGIVITVSLVIGLGRVVVAEDVKVLLGEAKKEIRKIERNMFSGKSDKAISSLPTLKEKLLKIKTVNPKYPGLKSLEKKHEKLDKDLERRTGKDLGGGTLTTAGARSQTKVPPQT